MGKKRWLFYLILTFLIEIPVYKGLAQYVNMTENNPYIREYVEESDENWNRSIIFVFYNNEPCIQCAQAMQMIYNIYQERYSQQYSFFEINYTDPGEEIFQKNFNLSQPLTVVLVRINDGLARGAYKIQRPEIWIEDPDFFAQNLIMQIDNFFNS